MTLTLILTRHAKSDWGTPGLADFDRPLNDRGRRAAPVMGRWIAGLGLVPDEVIVSGARRTVETWEGMAGAFDPAPQVRTDGALYDATAETILRVLTTASAPVVLMIGHNPGFGDFAARLASAAPAHPRFSEYPTAATTVFRLPGPVWTDTHWRAGEVIDFAVPRDLGDQ